VMRPSTVRRPLALLVCIVQLVLGGGTGFADAWLESASAGPTAAHVEETGRSCPPTHADDCIVCRQLTALYGPSDASRVGAPVVGRLAQVNPGAIEPASARLTRALLPRAPPLA